MSKEPEYLINQPFSRIKISPSFVDVEPTLPFDAIKHNLCHKLAESLMDHVKIVSYREYNHDLLESYVFEAYLPEFNRLAKEISELKSQLEEATKVTATMSRTRFSDKV